jgi:hypothetical protein
MKKLLNKLRSFFLYNIFICMIKLLDILLEKRDTVRDRTGSLLGTIDTLSNGMQILKDRNGRRLGIYNPSTNKTHSHTGALVGMGNVLTSLITMYK